jgi:hypothetical protein
MKNKNTGAHMRSPLLDPKPQHDSLVLTNMKNHLPRNVSLGPSGKEDFSMLLSPKSPKGLAQERQVAKLCFGSTAAISNDCMTTMMDRQSSKATDLEQASGREKNRLNINKQLTSIRNLSIIDPEEADILKNGGFCSLKEAFECQTRMVGSFDPV